METTAPDPEAASNLRTEYSELSRYFTEVIKYRFTVLGLFVAGQGVVILT